MQLLVHKNKNLTVKEKFFIDKSIELLYRGSIDSYRIKLHNPITILKELKYCLESFHKGRIKHFLSIKEEKNSGKSLTDEVFSLLDLEPSYLNFNGISKDYIKRLLKELNKDNYKLLVPSIEILLADNEDYLERVIQGVWDLIEHGESSKKELFKLDTSLNILFSLLINKGFSKDFLYRLVYGYFVRSQRTEKEFSEQFDLFKQRVSAQKANYQIVFRIDTTKKVFSAITDIEVEGIILSDQVDEITFDSSSTNSEFEGFNAKSENRKFIYCCINAFDHFSALDQARKELSEYLDVINLGLSGEFLRIHGRALVYDVNNEKKGKFQTNKNFLDGTYKVEEAHYRAFTDKIPSILKNQKIADETKEKIKSAVRYLRLGNQSTEIEHIFVNYWIGLEYLFSNYDAQNTISRLKEHFINAHSLAYTKRNLHSFEKVLLQLEPAYTDKIKTLKPETGFLLNPDFYKEVAKELINDYPLIAYRAMKLADWFFPDNGDKPNVKKYLNRHKDNLRIHFTRIYRLRNEIVHDAAMNTNNHLIVSNLRYYLTFILNEVIDHLSNPVNNYTCIEDYFTSNELKLGNIEHKGFLLEDFLNVKCSLEFIS